MGPRIDMTATLLCTNLFRLAVSRVKANTVRRPGAPARRTATVGRHPPGRQAASTDPVMSFVGGRICADFLPGMDRGYCVKAECISSCARNLDGLVTALQHVDDAPKLGVHQSPVTCSKRIDELGIGRSQPG